MKIPPFRLLLNHLLGISIFLALWTGLSLAAGTDTQSGSSVAVLKAITVSPDAYQVEIKADRDLTYTFYKTLNPVRAVIDLAQTEPANLQPQEINAGMVKRVTVTKHSFGGGFLSRVEIELTSDDEFTVSTDPADKSRLILTFAKTESVKPAASAAIIEPVAATPSAKPTEPAPQMASEEPKTQPAAIPSAKVESAPEMQKQAVDPAQTRKTATAVALRKDGVEIQLTDEPDSYKAFRMDKPGRLVLDLYGIRSALKENVIEVNSLGISRVRIGSTPEKVRFVFDAQKAELPGYNLAKTEKGIVVTFTSPEISGETPAAAAPAAEKRQSEPAGKLAKGGATVESIDFSVEGEYSRVTVTTDGGCSPGKPVKVAKGVALTFKNCQLPKKLQRVMDTGSFQSVVLAVNPYPVKTKTGTDTRLLANLRADAPTTVRQEGNRYIWEIKNTELPQPKADDRLKAPKGKGDAVQEELAADTGLDLKPAGDPAIKTTTAGEKKYTGRRVSLEFSDADVRKIFQLIAEVSNLNFLIADDVTGTISIKLVNVPWDQALDVILESKGLEMKRDGNIIQIKPKGRFKTLEQEVAEAKKAKERLVELVTEVLDVNFANVTDVERQFTALKSERGTITKDERTNRIIVKDLPSAIAEMKFLLKNIDIPEKQVLIEARIVEATTRFSQDLGVQWALHATDSSAKVLNVTSADAGWGGVIGLPPPSSGFLPTNKYGMGLGMSFGKIGPDVQLDMRLSAAASNGQVKIISSPKVVTLNNKQAKISQGSAFYLATTSAEGTKQEKVDATLSLEVKPHITPDGSIIMTITAKNDSPEATPPAGATASVSKKEATTELLVKNGETTVIGGIYVDRDEETNSGVPFLMDIPLFGWLFKSNTTAKTKSELLIFITPRIIN